MDARNDRQEWLARLEQARPGDVLPRGLLDTLVTVHEAREALPEGLALRPTDQGLLVVRMREGQCWDCLAADAPFCARCMSELDAMAAGRLQT